MRNPKLSADGVLGVAWEPVRLLRLRHAQIRPAARHFNEAVPRKRKPRSGKRIDILKGERSAKSAEPPRTSVVLEAVITMFENTMFNTERGCGAVRPDG